MGIGKLWTQDAILTGNAAFTLTSSGVTDTSVFVVGHCFGLWRSSDRLVFIGTLV